MSDRTYPEEPTDSFPAPPLSFSDTEGREISVEVGGVAEFDRLVAMYEAFDPGDRAQGIPPVDDAAIREWLDALLVEDAIHVLARHDGDVVGHAVLVPDREEAYELAVFVLHDYQGAGIGTRLMRALLGQGRTEGVGKVWLTVERWNEPAVALYRKVGFETTDAQSFELEMAIRLA